MISLLKNNYHLILVVVCSFWFILACRIPITNVARVTSDEISTLIRSVGASDAEVKSAYLNGQLAGTKSVRDCLYADGNVPLYRVIRYWFKDSPHGSLPWYLFMWWMRKIYQFTIEDLRVFGIAIMSFSSILAFQTLLHLGVSRSIATITSLAILTSPSLTMIACEARQYPLSVFFAALLVHNQVRSKTTPIVQTAVLWAVSIYTSVFLFLPVAVNAVYQMVTVKADRLRRGVFLLGTLMVLCTPLAIAIWTARREVVRRMSWVSADSTFGHGVTDTLQKLSQFIGELFFWNDSLIPFSGGIKTLEISVFMAVILSAIHLVLRRSCGSVLICLYPILSLVSLLSFDLVAHTSIADSQRYLSISIYFFFLTAGYLLNHWTERLTNWRRSFITLLTGGVLYLQIASHYTPRTFDNPENDSIDEESIAIANASFAHGIPFSFAITERSLKLVDHITRMALKLPQNIPIKVVLKDFKPTRGVTIVHGPLPDLRNFLNCRIQKEWSNALFATQCT